MNQGYEDMDLSAKTYKSTWSLVSRALTTCLGSFFIGITLVTFDIIKRSFCVTPSESMEDHFQLFSGAVPLGAALGAFPLSFVFYKHLSRRQALWVSASIGIIGSLLLIKVGFLSLFDNCPNISNPFLIIGRALQGIAVGTFTVSCLLILNESTPIELKMMLGIFYQLSIQLGIILAYIIELAFVPKQVTVTPFYPYSDPSPSNHHSRYLMLYTLIGVSILPLLAQIFLTVFVFKQQTVKYLLSQGKQDQAKSLISSIYKEEYSTEVFLDYQALHNTQENIDENSFFMEYDLKIIKRKTLAIGIIVSILQQLSGINFYNLYISEFIQVPMVYFSISQLSGTLFLILARSKLSFVSRFFNRRVLLLKGGAIACMVIAIAFLIIYLLAVHGHSPNLVLESAIIMLFMFVFGLALGPIVCIYSSEILEPVQLQCCMCINWLFGFFTVSVLTLFSDQIDSSNNLVTDRFVISVTTVGACVLFLGLDWRFRFLIETKNRTPLEIVRRVNDVRICAREE